MVSESMPTMENKKFMNVPSKLEDIDGNHKEMRVEIAPDGKVKAMAFFDIDKTLSHLTPLHEKAICELFPDADPKELAETYFGGFKLGNSYREFDRMNEIYINGHNEWRDAEVYRNERMIPHQDEIDGGDSEIHKRAAEYLAHYGEAAGAVADRLYENNPEAYEQAEIKPILALAEYYKKLGVAMVGMTANSPILVKRLAKYLKLSDLFIDIATDEDMVGGGKEVAINHLIEGMEKLGIPVAKTSGRLIFVGDSLRGDVGSGAKFGNYRSGSGSGILVLEDDKELAEIQKQIASGDPELQKILASVSTEAFVVNDVPKNADGSPELASKGREDFLHKL